MTIFDGGCGLLSPKATLWRRRCELRCSPTASVDVSDGDDEVGNNQRSALLGLPQMLNEQYLLLGNDHESCYRSVPCWHQQDQKGQGRGAKQVAMSSRAQPQAQAQAQTQGRPMYARNRVMAELDGNRPNANRLADQASTSF